MIISLVSQIRNEIDIIDTFLKHVDALFDKVYLLDHLSSDGTTDVLKQAVKQRPDWKYFLLDFGGQYQEEVSNYFLNEVVKDDSDFIFFLDADEFIDVENRNKLEQLITPLISGEEVGSLQWRNCIAENFEESSFSSTSRFWVPAQVSEFRKTFVPKKTFFRMDKELRMSKGNHYALQPTGEVIIPKDVGTILHLPVRSRHQIHKKVFVSFLSHHAIKNRIPGDSHQYIELLEKISRGELTDDMLRAYTHPYENQNSGIIETTIDDLLEKKYLLTCLKKRNIAFSEDLEFPKTDQRISLERVISNTMLNWERVDPELVAFQLVNGILSISKELDPDTNDNSTIEVRRINNLLIKKKIEIRNFQKRTVENEIHIRMLKEEIVKKDEQLALLREKIREQGNFPSEISKYTVDSYLPNPSKKFSVREKPLRWFFNSIKKRAKKGKIKFFNITTSKSLKNHLMILRTTPLFDYEYYSTCYPDVVAAGMDLARHYLEFGWLEARNPSAAFNNNDYLTRYPDVLNEGINPLIHFIIFGESEGRKYSSVEEVNTKRNIAEEIIETDSQLLINKKNETDDNIEIVKKLQDSFSIEEKSQEVNLFRMENGNGDYVPTAPGLRRKKISVIITAYNHGNYISKCLDNVINQKGNFDLEIIIGDDASTDNSREIISDYCEKYPKSMKVLPEAENMGVTKNLKRCLDVCTGEYIAICEGDDYWVDDLKLQKQSDYLDQHPGISMCFSMIALFYEDENRFTLHDGQSQLVSSVLKPTDLIESNSIGNFSCCMYRSEIIRKLPHKLFDIYTVDWIFNITYSQFGDIGFIKEVMSVYRIHKDGAWSGKSQKEQLLEGLKHIDVYNELLDFKYDDKFTELKDKINYYLNSPGD